MVSPKKAVNAFDHKYWGKGVEWEGYVVRVALNDDDPLQRMTHSATLTLKMDLDDHEGQQGPDLGISLSERSLEEMETVIEGLHRGDRISFQGSLQSMGDNNHLHHLHAWSIEQVEGHKNMDVYATTSGRYKVASKE